MKTRFAFRNLKVVLFAVILLFLAAGTPTAFAEGNIPGGLETPAGLNAGEQFRFVFVTSVPRDATSRDIAVYDQFVTDLAVTAGLDTYDGNPVTWQVLGSTLYVAAINRLPYSSPGMYLLDGTLIASSGSDLWDGSIANPINVTELGTTINVEVWTGTSPDGSQPHNRSRYFVLGSSFTTNFAYSGRSDVTDVGWTQPNNVAPQNYLIRNLYAVSNVLTAAVSNLPPTADAGGSYQGNEGTAIAMSAASASDPDMDTLSYSWSVDSAFCSFDDASLLTPNLTCYDIGDFTATLTVSDNVNPSVSSDAVVTIAAPTSETLSALVVEFVANPGVANALTSKLDTIQNAIDNGNANAKAGAINAFINQVNAQTGKKITSEQAAILIKLVQDL